MNLNQFGMTKSIFSGVDGVDVRIISILHDRIVCKQDLVYVLIPLRRNHTQQNGCEEVIESLRTLDNGICHAKLIKIYPSNTSRNLLQQSPRYSIPKFLSERTMVNVLLHQCCAEQIDLSCQMRSPLICKKVYFLDKQCLFGSTMCFCLVLFLQRLRVTRAKTDSNLWLKYRF